MGAGGGCCDGRGGWGVVDGVVDGSEFGGLDEKVVIGSRAVCTLSADLAMYRLQCSVLSQQLPVDEAVMRTQCP